MSNRTFRRNVWFCQWCGNTFGRSDRDPPRYACSYCTNGRMIHAMVEWTENIPSPDPLAVLLIDHEAVLRNPGSSDAVE